MIVTCIKCLHYGAVGRLLSKPLTVCMQSRNMALLCSFVSSGRICRKMTCLSIHMASSPRSSTIYALSSGHGKCGVSVIRVSGCKSKDAIQKLTRKKELPRARMAALRRFYDPESHVQIDRGLLLWFPGPDSFTGEDCCEFHVHGGQAVLEAMFTALAHVDGLRYAEAGEFTKRAFENGKLDLTEVEGLADLIHAETEAQRRLALRQMEGALSKLYAHWRERLLKCCANVEATIDFGEEENIEEGVMVQVDTEVKQILDEIRLHLDDSRKGERLRNGVRIAIIGQPNVGKSSLLNFLCQRPAAIVSSVPGTTRDVIETALNLGGYPVIISDTAGLRVAEDEVESEGIKRAIDKARNADIKVVLVDITEMEELLLLIQSPAGNPVSDSCQHQQLLTEFLFRHLTQLGVINEKQSLLEGGDNSQATSLSKSSQISIEDCILLFNKMDLTGVVDNSVTHGQTSGLVWCFVSCLTEQGLDHFLDVLQAKVKAMCWNPDTGNPSLTQARHREHLKQCMNALNSYLKLQDEDVVLAASSLQMALRHIGKLTGKITTEEVLDVVFRDFCIGK